MRYLTLAAIAAGTLMMSTGPGAARTYPWCAYYNWSTYNCGFVTFRQCLATVSGTGGWCERNPRAYRTDRPYRRRY